VSAPDTFALADGLLREDPQYARIPAADRGGLVTMALAEGRTLAGAVRTRWGRDPDAIARRCGIPVIEDDDGVDYGTTVVFAEYVTRPAHIVLHRPAIQRIDAVLARHGAGGHAARSVYVAHELFHHFDCTGPQPSLAQRHRLTLFALGRWRWTTGLTSLAEIAAGAFAQDLLGLAMHPRILELALRHEAWRSSAETTACSAQNMQSLRT
jgi:hypothetical protein